MKTTEPKEKVYKAFRIEKFDAKQGSYGSLDISLYVSPNEDRDGAVLAYHWQSGGESASFGWYGMSMTIREQGSNYNFLEMTVKHIAPLLKKMLVAELRGSSIKPYELCDFLDKQKIPQMVYFQGEKYLLKDLRKNNFFAVRDLRYPAQRAYHIMADSELDAKYRIKKRQGSSAADTLDSYDSRRLDISEYEDLFEQSWRKMFPAPVND